MKSNGSLRSEIEGINKNKRLQATIIDVAKNTVSVRFGNGSRILRGLPYIGGPVIVGQSVYVDYSSGSPVVQAKSSGAAGASQLPQGSSQSVIVMAGGGEPGTGTGDVVGPESAVDGHLAVFSGGTGKLIRDGGPVPTSGIAGNTIVVYHSNGNDADEYEATDAGLDLASAAAESSACKITVPSNAVIGSAHVLAGCVYIFPPMLVVSGSLTLSDNTRVYGLRLEMVANDSSLLTGVIGPASGTAIVYLSRLTCTQSGSGNTAPVVVRGGNIFTRDCYINGVSASGVGSEIVYQGGGRYISTQDDYSDADLSELVNGMEWHFPSSEEGWVCVLNGDPNATAAWDSTEGHTLAGNLHVHRNGGGGNYIHTWAKQIVGLRVATGNTLSAWIKQQCDYMSPLFNLRIRYSDGSYDENIWHPESSFDWTQQVVTVTAPNNGKTVFSIEAEEVMASLDYGYTRDTRWDDIVLVGTGVIEAIGSKFGSSPTGIVPLIGDRSAWDVDSFGLLHASDWTAGDSHHPIVTISAALDAIMSIAGQYFTLDPQAPNTVFSGPATTPSAPPTFRVLTSTDIPIIAHDKISDFHSEVTTAIATSRIEDLENVVESAEAIGDILQIDEWIEHPSGADYLYDSALLGKAGSGSYANAYDKNKTNQWISSGGPHWTTAEFLKKKFLSRVVITANTGAYAQFDLPLHWHIYGSNTGMFGGEEVDMGSSSASSLGIFTTSFASPRTAYRYYKITFPDNANLRLNEIEFYTQEDEAKWVNKTLADAGIAATEHKHDSSSIISDGATDGQVLTADGSGGAAWETQMGGHIIENEGISSPSRAKLNFVGSVVSVTDDVANDRTIVTIVGDGTGAAGGGGSPLSSSWYIDGALAVAQQVGPSIVVPQDTTIQAILVYIESLGSSGSTIVDVNINGTTVFTTQSNRPALAYDATSHVISGTPDITSLVAGDVLTLDIDQVAVGASAITVVVQIEGGSTGGSGTDVNAIHDNVPGEINALTEKVSVAGDDLILIEDSADSYNKKKVKVSSLPGLAIVTNLSTSTEGLDYNRATSGSFAYLAQQIRMLLLPFTLVSVYWDVRIAGNYTLTVRDINDNVLATKSLTGIIAGAETEFVFDTNVVLNPGAYWLRLTVDGANVTWWDKSGDVNYYYGTFSIINQCVYGGTPNPYRAPIKLKYYESRIDVA